MKDLFIFSLFLNVLCVIMIIILGCSAQDERATLNSQICYPNNYITKYKQDNKQYVVCSSKSTPNEVISSVVSDGN